MFAGLQLCGAFVVDEREQKPGLRVRLGINLGPVKLIKDVNGALNAIGDGINAGQRIMSFAAANQILVSQSFFEVVSRLSDDYKKLFELKGVEKDKHVREHTVYHLVPPGAEKREPPPVPTAEAQAVPPAPAPAASVAASPERRAPRGRSILWLAGGAAVVVLAAVGAWRFWRPAAPATPNLNAAHVGNPAPAKAPDPAAPAVSQPANAASTANPGEPPPAKDATAATPVVSAPVVSAPAKITPPSQPEAVPTVVKSGPHVGDSRVNSRDGLRYVWIPPGTFTMGCSPGDNECFDDEKPAHEV
jgi:hypothetical protein